MSLLSSIEGAVPGLGWIRTALKLAPWISIAVLALGLGLTRARLAAVRQADKLAEQTRRADDAQRQAEWAGALASASAAYADRLADRQPIIDHSKDLVNQYAQTPAGRAPCLAADRVRGIDDLDRQLATPAAGESSGAVQDPPGPPPD